MDMKFCGKSHLWKDCVSHAHKSWEIVLYINGSVAATVDDVTYNAGTGDILIIPPDTVHCELSDDEYSVIYLQCDNLDFSGSVLLHDDDGSVRTLMNLLHKVYTEKESFYKTISNCLVQTIAAYLNKLSDHSCRCDFVNQLKNEMYENLANSDFDISECIVRLGYSTDYARRRFREEVGMTPLAYLTGIRLNCAKRLLWQETYNGLADVAEQCGFKDSFYLSKMFKQHFGISPQAYRKSKQA